MTTTPYQFSDHRPHTVPPFPNLTKIEKVRSLAVKCQDDPRHAMTRRTGDTRRRQVVKAIKWLSRLVLRQGGLFLDDMSVPS